MKKKTVDEKFVNWIKKEYPSFESSAVTDVMDASYKAGHKSAAIELGRELRQKDEEIQGLKELVMKLVEACEGYAVDNNELEATVNALEYEQQQYWEKCSWEVVELGDWICMQYGNASTLFKAAREES
jgi:hypothetical protein